MTTRMVDLPEHLKETKIFFIGSGNADELQSIRPALINGHLNSTGYDLALFFSSPEKAIAYRDHFHSLKNLDVFEATIFEMIEIFDGKVQYFIVDGVGN